MTDAPFTTAERAALGTLGFSLTEGIISSPDEIGRFEIVDEDLGIELRMWLSEPRAAALGERRRRVCAALADPAADAVRRGVTSI